MYKGKVKFYNNRIDVGYGFITSNHFDRDVYFKATSIKNADSIDLNSLSRPDSVWVAHFSDVNSTDRGFEASSVRLEEDVIKGAKILHAIDDTDAITYINGDGWFNVYALELSGSKRLEFMVGSGKEILARIVKGGSSSKNIQ